MSERLPWAWIGVAAGRAPMRRCLTVLLLGGLCGCVYVPPRPAGPPPAAVVENVPPPPPGYYVWRPGHWRWNGYRYVWARGHYVVRPA